jgi:hypothetical protein
MFREAMKGTSDGSEVSDESPVITRKAQELLDFSLGCW